MSAVLFTGAGFSYNWGGWLADDVFEYLLGDLSLIPSIRNQLWQDKSVGGNYETTIQALRDRARAGDDGDYKTMNSMLAGMFSIMNQAFSRQGFQFNHTSDISYQITTFMQRFDYIFTLNQDTLLERHYLTEGFGITSQRRWNGYCIPGVEPSNPAGSRNFDLQRVNRSDFRFAPQTQPYVKLHGSSNWITETGYLLISGGNKEADINEVPLLAWYAEQFRRVITNASARVMIIGYGFGDEHINRMFVEAAKAGARFFIVNPMGTSMLFTPIAPGTSGLNLSEHMAQQTIGASRRGLSSTFSTDSVEFIKLNRFLSTN